MQDIFTYEKAAKLRELDIKYTMFIYYITTCEISINYRIDNDDQNIVQKAYETIYHVGSSLEHMHFIHVCFYYGNYSAQQLQDYFQSPFVIPDQLYECSVDQSLIEKLNIPKVTANRYAQELLSSSHEFAKYLQDNNITQSNLYYKPYRDGYILTIILPLDFKLTFKLFNVNYYEWQHQIHINKFFTYKKRIPNLLDIPDALFFNDTDKDIKDRC